MNLRKLHVDKNGSMVRPLPLLEVFDGYARGEADEKELVMAQDGPTPLPTDVMSFIDDLATERAHPSHGRYWTNSGQQSLL